MVKRSIAQGGMRAIGLFRHNSGMALYLAALLPIILTGYRHDDIINSQLPQQLSFGSGQFLENLIQHVATQNNLWITIQGRFFPGAILETSLVFAIFQNLIVYKFFLLTLWFLVALQVKQIGSVFQLDKSQINALLLGLASTVTLRHYADAVDSFSGLLPFTIFLILRSFLMISQKKSKVAGLFGYLLWGLSLVTYEVGIVLTPAFAVILFFYFRERFKAIILTAISAAAAINVILLRSIATGIAPAYKTNLDPIKFIETYIQQAIAGLPLAQFWMPNSSTPSLTNWKVFLVILILLVTFSFYFFFVSPHSDPSTKYPSPLVILGLSFWLLPPALVAVSERWQESMPPGQGYLSVTFSYVGIAFIVPVILEISKKLKNRLTDNSNLERMLIAISALNIAGSFSIAFAL